MHPLLAAVDTGWLARKRLAAAGLVVLALVVFAETGLLAGFFLPGDSLLFTAGLLVATGVLERGLLLLVALMGLPMTVELLRAAAELKQETSSRSSDRARRTPPRRAPGLPGSSALRTGCHERRPRP